MLTEWQRWFPGCEPIAYHMRDAFSDRWVRFHSLPGSKRYPEDAAEYATVLERHNVILGGIGSTGGVGRPADNRLFRLAGPSPFRCRVDDARLGRCALADRGNA